MPDWLYPSPFILELSVQNDDIDLLGHANNTAYAHWCQSAAWAHSAALGVNVADYPRLDRAMVIREANYQYHLAAMPGDRLSVGTWLTRSDARLTMTRAFEIRRQHDHALLCSGRWELVCVRVSDGRPMRMPPVFLAAYEPAVIAMP